jgi:hypothetical protein
MRPGWASKGAATRTTATADAAEAEDYRALAAALRRVAASCLAAALAVPGKLDELAQSPLSDPASTRNHERQDSAVRHQTMRGGTLRRPVGMLGSQCG